MAIALLLSLDPAKRSMMKNVGRMIQNESSIQQNLLASAKKGKKQGQSGSSFEQDAPYVPSALGFGKITIIF